LVGSLCLEPPLVEVDRCFDPGRVPSFPVATMADTTQTVVSALLERGIVFKKASVESDFNLDTEYGRKNAQWAAEHLSPHTLLSKEEVALYVLLPLNTEHSFALTLVSQVSKLGNIRSISDVY
jgi:hypothetical protein